MKPFKRGRYRPRESHGIASEVVQPPTELAPFVAFHWRDASGLPFDNRISKGYDLSE